MTVRQIARRIATATSRRANRILIGAHNSVTRLYAVRRAYLTRRADRHNAALAETGTYTAAQYLRHVLHAPEEFVARFASAFGRAAAKVHRALFAAEPAQDGLTVIGNHPRFTSIATYGPDAYAALEQAATDHKATAALKGSAPVETPAQPVATIDPKILALQLSDRHFERTPGELRTVCRAYVAERVAAIVEGMHRTPANYDPASGLLTDAGAEIAAAIIRNSTARDGWHEIGRRMDETASLIGVSR